MLTIFINNIMQKENIFKTKTGYCHILPDKIILTRDGVIGNVSKVFFGNEITRMIIIYSAIAVFVLYFAVKAYQKGEMFSVIFRSSVAAYLIYKIKLSMNFSAASTIERNKIKEVKFIDAKYGATRSRFEVLFEDEKGKLKTRLILLPGSLDGGESETAKALEIMKSENITWK